MANPIISIKTRKQFKKRKEKKRKKATLCVMEPMHFYLIVVFSWIYIYIYTVDELERLGKIKSILMLTLKSKPEYKSKH